MEAYEKYWLVLRKCYSFVVILFASIWADDSIDEALSVRDDARGALFNCHCCGNSESGRRYLVKRW
jgi:uncharacterized membrane protein